MLEQVCSNKVLPRAGAQLIAVRGRRYSNAAAKFWTTLDDELAEAFPAERRFELQAVHEDTLCPALLFPELEMENALRARGPGYSMDLRQALDDLELYGQPGPVSMLVGQGVSGATRMTLPLDCVDAEIFLYLVAWLLEWGEVPDCRWRESELAGIFRAVDPLRSRIYAFDFKLARAPFKEGLFTWKLAIEFKRGAPRGMSPPAPNNSRRGQAGGTEKQ